MTRAPHVGVQPRAREVVLFAGMKVDLKAVIARDRKSDGAHQVLSFALNDGTPVKSADVKIDDGTRQKARFDPSNTQYPWKLLTPGGRALPPNTG